MLLNAEKAAKVSDLDELYYLFELGKPLALKDPVHKASHHPIAKSMRLTTLPRLEKAQLFSEVDKVYEEALI